VPSEAGASIIRNGLLPVAIALLLVGLLSLGAGAAASSAFAPTEGQEFSGQVGVAPIACKKEGELFNCGALASTFSAKIRWGDGTESTGKATQTECAETICDYAVTGTQTYADEGHYAVAFTVPNPFGVPNPREVSTAAEVADAALTNPTPSSGLGESEGHAGSYGLMTFADSNPSATPSDFTALIDWGDGSASPGTVTASAGAFAVSGSHTYAEEGAHTASVTVTDDGGQMTTAAPQIAGADASLSATADGSLTATTGVPATLALAHFSDSDPLGVASDYTTMVEWGDGTASAGTVAADSSGGFDVIAAHSYGAQGIYGITVRISDAFASVQVATSVSVAGATGGNSSTGGAKPAGSAGTGAVECRVPKLKGKKLAAARRVLKRHHCALGKVKRKRRAGARRGVVLSQTPKAGSRLHNGARISLVITASKP
jgi:hypothetical protein